MAQVFLHVGLNKTGTSSLQDFMAMNAALLLQREGVLYPQAGRVGAAHHGLTQRLKGRAPAGQPDVLQDLAAQIRQADKVVITSESLHGIGPKPMALLADTLKGHDVRVVFYLREHVAYLASWYQQNVQATTSSMGFETFCHYNHKPLHKVVQAWAQQFGASQITLRLYDRGVLAGGDIVQDFAQVLGLHTPLSACQRKGWESNPSVSGNLLFIKRLLNNFYSRDQAAQVVDGLTGLSKLKPSFRGRMHVPAHVVANLMKGYAQDRQVLTNQWGVHIAPLSGALDGHLTPDLSCLKDDWNLVMDAAAAKGMTLARAAQALRLGDDLSVFND
ncbi:MAG: hypothetical protein U5L74_15200 [Ideonella sp.]|nr:hypothetical protein [Ideonella sp.]